MDIYIVLFSYIYSGDDMRKRQDKSKLTTVEKLTQALEVPAPALTKTALIQLLGNRECIVEGCQGILEYSDDKIKLNIGNGVLIFFGDNLTIRALNGDGAVVEGRIMNLEFGS